MKTLNATQIERIKFDIANKAQARSALALAVTALLNGEKLKAALTHLSQSQRKKLSGYAKREGNNNEKILRMIDGNSAKLDEVAEAIYTHASRQSDAEVNFKESLMRVVQQQCIYDPNNSQVTKLPPGFLSMGYKGSDWKGLDFWVYSHGVGELFAHKCNNEGGGGQTSGHIELIRLVQRSSPCAAIPKAYDDPLNHRPGATEKFFRDGLSKKFSNPLRTLILVAIQDGDGREPDNYALRELAIPSIYAGSPLLVFGGSREEYWLVRPLMFILVLGWNSFTSEQQEILAEHVAEFSMIYPNGFHGFYGNPSAPWEVLQAVSVA